MAANAGGCPNKQGTRVCPSSSSTQFVLTVTLHRVVERMMHRTLCSSYIVSLKFTFRRQYVRYVTKKIKKKEKIKIMKLNIYYKRVHRTLGISVGLSNSFCTAPPIP